MPILTLTSADAGLTIPISGTASWTVNGTDAADTFEIAAGTPTTITGGAGTDVIKFLGSNTDYTTLLSGSNVIFTHTATGRTATIPVTGTGDSVQFGNGTAVTLSGSTAANVMLGTQNITATSAAVTGATGTATGGGTTPTTPTFSVGASATSVTEGGSVTFTVSLTGPAQTAATTVAYTLAGTGGAALGTDTGTHVPAGNSGTLTFAAGEITKTVVVPVAFDSTTETGEGMTITLSAPSTGTVLSTSASAAAVAFADPTAPTFTITSNAVAGSATEEGQAITYTITPSSVTDKAYTFTLSTVGDTLSGVATAATATDFSPASKTVTFAAGTTAAQTVVQTIVDDGVTEGLEGYKTTLLNSSFAAVGTSLTGLITDNTVTGATFTLTTGLDTATSKSSVSGILSDTVAQETWSLTDTVSGTTATTDTMAVRIIGDANGLTTRTGLQTSAIEKISFSYTDANDAAESNSISAASFTGVTALAVTGSSNVNTTSTVRDTIAFTSVAAGVALELGANTSQTSVNYTGVGTATSGDSVTLNATGGSTGAVTFADAAGDGFVTVNVATSGTASTIKSLAAGTDNTTVNVTGGSALTITDSLASTVTTFDASTATGAVNVGVIGATTLVAKGSTATTDVLKVTVDSTIATGAAISGFETVNLDTTAAGTGAFSHSLITGATKVNVTAGTGAVGSLTLTNAVSQSLNFVGSGSSTVAQVFDTVSQTLATNGTTDSIAVTINNGGTANALTTHTIGTIGLGNYEVVTITSADLATVTAGALILSGTATSLTINATNNLVVGGVSGAGTTLATINAGGSTGNVTLGALTTTGALTYTGSLGVDSLSNAAVGVSVTQTFNLGTGNDLFTTGTATTDATSTLKVNGEAGDDTIVLGVVHATQGLINIDGGTGSDTVRTNSTGTAAFVDSLANVEKIAVLNSGVANSWGVATGYADTVEITQVGTGTNVVNLNATGSASLANWTTVGTAADLTLNGTTGADTLTGAAQATIINGSAGADNITLGALNAVNDTIKIANGDSTCTIGGSGNAGTISGYDTVTNFLLNGDILDFTTQNGTLSTVTAGNSTDSSLTIGGSAVATHTAVGALFSFVKADTTAATITDNASLAAVVQYINPIDLGSAGASIAFIGTIGGVAQTWVYTQTTDNASSTYELVQLVGVTATGNGLSATNGAGLVSIS